MPGINGLNEQNLKKKIVAFDLEDILISGQIAKGINAQKARDLLSNLSTLEKKISGFGLFLVSGFSAAAGKKKLAESGLEKFFKPENVFFVGQGYVDSMEEFDRQRYLRGIGNNGLFQDEYFKQKALQKISEARNKDEIVFACHDLLSDAYYSQRFSGVDAALVKGALSLKHVRVDKILKGLLYVNLNWADFKKLLLGKKHKPNYSVLKKFIENYLQRELIGGLQINAGALAMKRENN